MGAVGRRPVAVSGRDWACSDLSVNWPLFIEVVCPNSSLTGRRAEERNQSPSLKTCASDVRSAFLAARLAREEVDAKARISRNLSGRICVSHFAFTSRKQLRLDSLK